MDYGGAMIDPEASFVICLPADRPMDFTDNVFGVCDHCERSVQHRPSVPRTVKKLCPDCAAAITSSR
jgi:hypothetical protein